MDTVVEDVRGDVRDYAKLEPSMMDFAPEVAFHLAAQAIVRRSYADPVGTYATNVMGDDASSGGDLKNTKRARSGVRYHRQVLTESGMDLAVS